VTSLSDPPQSADVRAKVRFTTKRTKDTKAFAPKRLKVTEHVELE
jgi:hypothetical protein